MCTSKISTHLCFVKQKIKKKKWFCKSCLQCFSSENVLIKHEEPVPFKIYADFECNLRDVETYEGSYPKNIMNMFLVVLLIKLFTLMIGLLSQLLFIEVNILLMNLLNQFLKNINIAEK